MLKAVVSGLATIGVEGGRMHNPMHSNQLTSSTKNTAENPLGKAHTVQTHPGYCRADSTYEEQLYIKTPKFLTDSRRLHTN